MITINGQKMGKSLGNFISLDEFFTGSHPLLSEAFSPMTIRFFILQAHYRSTVDFSNEALIASQKGLQRLTEAYERLHKITTSGATTVEVKPWNSLCKEAMDDDLNTPVVISHLFDAAKAINTVYDGKGTLSASDLNELKATFQTYMSDILGLKTEQGDTKYLDSYKKAIDLILSLRLEAKQNKNWALSDKIRDELASYGFSIKDTKDGFEWSL